MMLVYQNQKVTVSSCGVSGLHRIHSRIDLLNLQLSLSFRYCHLFECFGHMMVDKRKIDWQEEF